MRVSRLVASRHVNQSEMVGWACLPSGSLQPLAALPKRRDFGAARSDCLGPGITTPAGGEEVRRVSFG